MSKRERILLRVERGALVPADAHSQQRLRERGYRVGDVLAAELAKPRSPGFWRLAHRIGGQHQHARRQGQLEAPRDAVVGEVRGHATADGLDRRRRAVFLAHRATPARSSPVRTISAVTAGSVISSGIDVTVTPGTSAWSPSCTSQ